MDISGISSTSGSNGVSVSAQLQDNNVERFSDILQRTVNSAGEQEMSRAQIREASEMFEAHFLQMMFREMRRTNFNEDGFFSRNNAENIWTEMLDEVVAEQASQTNGGMGLADMIYRQMTLRYRDIITE